MTGDKIPLILVPGLCCTESLWRAQLDGLADIAEIHVTDAHWKFENMPEIAAEILSAAPPAFALAGLSMGGYICMEIMRQAPHRVVRLALLDTSARADTAGKSAARKQLIAQCEAGRFIGVSEKLAKSFVHPDRHADAPLLAAIKQMAEDVGQDGFLRQQRAIMARPDSAAGLAAISCRTLVLVGRQDGLTPLEVNQEIHHAVKGSRFVIVEECGHLPPMERPDETTVAMRDWLTW